MMLRIGLLLCVFATVALNSSAMCGDEPVNLDSAHAVSYRDDVQPILSQHCFRCHGPDAETRESGLRLDTRNAAVSVADSGDAAVVPGNLAASQLWVRVNHEDSDVRMPPPESGMPLNRKQREILRRWIETGAAYEQHWSFEPPTATALPLASQPHGPFTANNQIDARIVARLQSESLDQQPVADRYTLIRRVSLDLTGLPPSLGEVDAFVDDRSPDAYEQVVDRLLASPAFGERWARGWLDIARYADSAGYAQDPPRTIWRYRDWVIDALNHGMTYDQFTIDQLAGDLVDNPSADQLIATAFHRNTMTNSEGGTDDEEFRSAAVVDRVNTTMQVWMGLTMACAQCHTHKYDPITQDEYFSFYAVFNNTADADRGDESPVVTEWTPPQLEARNLLQAEIETLKRQRARHRVSDQAEPQTVTAQTVTAQAVTAQAVTAQADDTKVKAVAKADDEPNRDDATTADTRLQAQIAELETKLAAITGTTTPVLRELDSANRRETFVHLRGSFLNRGKQVSASIPAAFATVTGVREMSRLDVAKWLVDPSNPLAARVAANRLWEQLFGIGIVETSEDFGTQGERPTHPQLLDGLALDLIESGWDTKRLIRQIVLSHTYQQSSLVTPASAERDPRNRLLSRGSSYRWPAEMLRDQALAISGLLSRKMKGPSVRPPRPELGLRAAFGSSTDWTTSEGEDRYRRGLYTSWRRTTPYPSMTTLDAPSREVCTIRRIRTNTPLQAFVTLNDPAFVEAAQALAARMATETTQIVGDQLQHGFRLCAARPASAEELDRLNSLYCDLLADFSHDAEAAAMLAGIVDPSASQQVASRAALTVVANVLLNLDAVIAKK